MDNSRIGVTGAGGFLGSAFVDAGCSPILGDVSEKLPGHLTESIKSCLDVVIHCAALTDVDFCEKNFDLAYKANAFGVSNVVDAMNKDQLFVYLSTDHVFKGRAYAFGWNGYNENHDPNPINYYGATKWAGELVLNYAPCKTLIVRSSKVFSLESLGETMKQLEGGEALEFSSLICRSYIHRSHFVSSVLELVNKYLDGYNKDKIVHVAGDSVMSCYQFWSTLADIYGYDNELIVKRNYPLMNAVPRPMVAGLNVGRLKTYGIKTYHPVDGIYRMKEGKQ